MQTHRAAMGCPALPIITNLFMEDLKQKALARFPHHIKVWVRYVNSTMCAIKNDLIPNSNEHIKCISTRIKCPCKIEAEDSIPFLDTRITCKPGRSVKFNVYLNPMYTEQFLQFDSYQPSELGVIRTLNTTPNHRDRGEG